MNAAAVLGAFGRVTLLITSKIDGDHTVDQSIVSSMRIEEETRRFVWIQPLPTQPPSPTERSPAV